jgi:hypothetical protein
MPESSTSQVSAIWGSLRYVWLDDTLVAVLSSHDGSRYQYVETDHLGTPRAIVKLSTDEIVWRWNLTPTAFENGVRERGQVHLQRSELDSVIHQNYGIDEISDAVSGGFDQDFTFDA